MNILKKAFIKSRLKIRGFFLGLAGFKLPGSIKVYSPEETLDEIRKIMEKRAPGAYFRFGDGEANALNGLGAIEQDGDKNLAVEMREAFSLSGPGIVKSLMIHSRKYGFSAGMESGAHFCTDQWAENLLRNCFEYFIGEKIYSHAALAYASVYKPEEAIKFLTFLKSFDPIFVGNRDIPFEILTKLFGKTVHIKTEPKGAYGQIDGLERDILAAIKLRDLPYDVVVLAAGPAAKILQKRILTRSKGNLFLFDFGSLIDALSGKNTRAWIEQGSFDGKYRDELLSKL